MSFTVTHKFAILAFGCASLVFNADAIGQEETGQEIVEVEMAVDEQTGGPIVISSSRMSFSGDGEGGTPTFEFVTSGDMLGDMFPGGNIDPLSLLDNKDVREELELVGDQLEKYQQAQKELKEKIMEKTKLLSSGEMDPATLGSLAKELREMKRAGQRQMEAMLMPHQLDRLKQVALQMQMKRRGAANTLLSDQVAEALGIDEAQKKRIKDREKELKKELAERMEELKIEIREKLLAELTSDQKAKLKTMSGDKFDYKQESISDRIKRQIGGRRLKSGS